MDEAKRLENLQRRGVDFLWVSQVFSDPARLEAIDDRRNYGETRYRTVGKVEDTYYMVIYTLRSDVRRIITAWRLETDVKARYQALHHGPDQGND